MAPSAPVPPEVGVFSVIMPTYNRAAFLPRAIGSVLAQSYPHWELLIVDDASTDATAELLRSYTDPRIRVLRNPVNRERSHSRNRALAAATGDFVCFLDSDDDWLPCHLQVHAEAWQQAPASLGGMFSQAILVTADGAKDLTLPPLDSCTSHAEYVMLHQPPTITWSLRTEVCQRFPFDERLHVNEDVVALTRLAARHPIQQLPAATARYHHHGDNTHQPGRDTQSPQVVAMKLLFADPAVRRAIPAKVRAERLRFLRHYRVEATYRWGTAAQARRALCSFLLHYPTHHQNRAKLILLLSKLPGTRALDRVQRAAHAVINAYY